MCGALESGMSGCADKQEPIVSTVLQESVRTCLCIGVGGRRWCKRKARRKHLLIALCRLCRILIAGSVIYQCIAAPFLCFAEGHRDCAEAKVVARAAAAAAEGAAGAWQVQQHHDGSGGHGGRQHTPRRLAVPEL